MEEFVYKMRTIERQLGFCIKRMLFMEEQSDEVSEWMDEGGNITHC